jgi:hypothetical protein
VRRCKFELEPVRNRRCLVGWDRDVARDRCELVGRRVRRRMNVSIKEAVRLHLVQCESDGRSAREKTSGLGRTKKLRDQKGIRTD